MRASRLFLGLAVLGLVLAAGVWVRGRNAGTPGVEETVSTPDVTHADRVVTAGGFRVRLSVSPHPPVAFRPIRFRVRVDSPSDALRPGVLENARVSFDMTMPMGEHRYTLARGDDGWHEAEVVLPMCGSGDPHWRGTLEGVVDGRPLTAHFVLDLYTPGSGS
jgi:hypothetical protein